MAKAMALLGLKLILLATTGILANVAPNVSSTLCSDFVGPATGAAVICSIGSLQNCTGKELTGDVFVVGNGTSTWDVGASPLSFADDSRVTVSCLRILMEQSDSEVTQSLKINYTTLLSPPFIRRPSETQLFALTMRDVEISLSCAALLEWQHYLCGIQLPGRTMVHGNTISILSWTGNGAILEHVNMTCDPGTAGFSPACSMAVVDGVSDILDASKWLQDPYLPLVLTVSRDISFTDSQWPDNGLRITANVTLSATLGSNVTISFGLRTVLFNVDKNSSRTAFLSFRGCILVDLPLSYLPLNHPRRPFGVLSTALWPVYREEVAMGLYNCTLILTSEEFKFWSYWLSILVSPIPGVSTMGNWTFANDVQLGKSGVDYIHLVHYMGRYTTLMNVRYQVSNDVYATQQRNNILQITNDAAVPPTVVFQARDSEDLLTALLSSPSASAAQHGQYIILTGSVTTVDDTVWPATGAPIRYPTTITTWPSSWVAFDLRLMRDAFIILPSTLSSVVIKNVVLLNLCGGDPDNEFAGLTTGLWAFKFSNWRNTEQQRLSFDRAIVVVSREEVGYYIDATVDRMKTDAWISSFQVDSYDTANRSWVQFATLATSRFSAQSINITNTIPDILDSNSINLTTVAGFPWTARMTEQPSNNKRDILLFTLLVITLPTALGAALLTFLLMKRRRISRLCLEGVAQRKLAEQTDNREEDQSEGEEHEGKTSRKQEPPVCCFPLSFPLRKSKFVNPLFDDASRVSPEIVLTGVLGPAALGRSLVPVPPEAAILATNASSSTVADSYLQVDDVAVTGPELVIEQATAENVSAETRSGSGRSSQAHGVLSAVPAELRPGAEVAFGLEATAAGSGVSSLSESCLAGSGPQIEHRWRSSCCPQSTGTGTPTAAAAAQSASAICGVIAGSLHDGLGGTPEAGELRFSPAAAAAVLATGQAAASGCGEDANAYAQRQGLFGFPGVNLDTSQGAVRNPRFLDMQQLDRLRHEIGDRHLEVQHSLGWGGCGVVYKGVWKGLQVAVKTILLQGDSKQSQQFLTEAAISASLQHANIVTTYLYELRPLDEVDPGTGDVEIQLRSTSSDGVQPQDREHMSCWKLYIVQEYCELGTLKAAIDQGYFKGPAGGPPNLGFLLTVALDMALGLEHVHSKNVVHGDVTVSNILLQACPSRPQGCVAKVADFGLSVKFEANQTYGYHLYGGTPHYMAPERVRGVLSKRSDIYSLGICLWELYCGTPPWRRNAVGAHHRGYGGGTTSSSVDSGGHHNHHHHPSFGDSATGTSSLDSFRFPRGCPLEFSTLVHACLSVNPQARPAATAVASTLQRLHRRYC